MTMESWRADDIEAMTDEWTEHVRQQWHEAAGDVAGGDGEGGAVGAAGGGLFQAEFEAHHEVDVGGMVLLQRGEDGRGGFAGDGICVEDLIDLLGFVIRAMDDFVLLAAQLGGVVLGVAPGGEVATETHGDGAGGDLGQAGDYDDVRAGDGAGETGGQSEGDGEAIGEPDDDVAHGLAGLKVPLDVGLGLGIAGDVMHGGSVSQLTRCTEDGAM